VWGIKVDEGTKQQNLVITHGNEPVITVDNIKVAQFIYLLLDNKEIRDVIDTIGRKLVLIAKNGHKRAQKKAKRRSWVRLAARPGKREITSDDSALWPGPGIIDSIGSPGGLHCNGISLTWSFIAKAIPRVA
jgi:hypothetical protein